MGIPTKEHSLRALLGSLLMIASITQIAYILPVLGNPQSVRRIHQYLVSYNVGVGTSMSTSNSKSNIVTVENREDASNLSYDTKLHYSEIVINFMHVKSNWSCI